jgi:hypothetical protein
MYPVTARNRVHREPRGTRPAPHRDWCAIRVVRKRCAAPAVRPGRAAPPPYGRRGSCRLSGDGPASPGPYGSREWKTEDRKAGHIDVGAHRMWCPGQQGVGVARLPNLDERRLWPITDDVEGGVRSWFRRGARGAGGWGSVRGFGRRVCDASAWPVGFPRKRVSGRGRGMRRGGRRGSRPGMWPRERRGRRCCRRVRSACGAAAGRCR